MISKGYLYVTNLGIFSNFYISIDCLSWIHGKGPIVAGKLRAVWVLPSPQILKAIIHDEFRQGIIGTTPKVFVFYFHHPCLFYPQYNLSLQALFCFHFPHFYFAYNFVVLQKSASQPAVLWCYTLKGHKQRTLIRGSNLKGYKPLFWISVNLSDTFKTQIKQKKHSFCMTLSRREKDGATSIISCMVYLIMVDMSFS